MSKRTGKHSAQQNDFLQPAAVTITTATNVGTNRPYLFSATGNAGTGGAVNLVWTLPNGSAPAISYDITTTPTTVTKNTTTLPTSGSPFVFEGLASGTDYTFTVVAKNNAGNSNPTTSQTVSVSTVPPAPNTPSVRQVSNDQNDYLTITISATGGSAITNFHWESTDSKSGDRGTSTAEFAVAQEANTAQQYRAYATNANGNSDWSGYSGSVTTPPYFPPYFPFFPYFPPFFPYFPPYFPYFPYFPPYFPYFPPFFPYFPYFPPFFPYFPPFFPYFPPFFPFFPFFPPRFCIEESTLVDTPSGSVAAKDLKVGDTLVSVALEELSTEPRSEENFIIGPTLTLGGGEPVETTIVDIIESTKAEIVYFNEDTTAKYSNEQSMFALVDGQFQTINAGLLKPGDYLVKVLPDGTYVTEEISSITEIYEPTTVYQYICEPYNWFIAGGYLVHQN
jgi:hypothetical protein